jgi:hypothetical protein
MKISTLALIAFTTLFLSAFAATNVQAQFGTLFTVNNNGDTNDADAGDGFVPIPPAAARFARRFRKQTPTRCFSTA